MKNKSGQEKILAKYEKRGEEIIQKMLSIITRAQRKVDEISYRKIMEKIESR